MLLALLCAFVLGALSFRFPWVWIMMPSIQIFRPTEYEQKLNRVLSTVGGAGIGFILGIMLAPH
jgi:uncharacterized membrane protein YccC